MESCGRPDPDREPELFALWHRYVTEIWTEENFVPPVFEESEDMPHNLKGEVRQTEGGYTSSGGWSGAVVVGEWVGVMGMWQVPTVSAPNTPVGPGGWQCSSWVGLDGAKGLIPGTTTTDVLQAGVSHNVVAATDGQAAYPAYYAWYEWVVSDLSIWNRRRYPYIYPIIIKSPIVQAGDEYERHHPICHGAGNGHKYYPSAWSLSLWAGGAHQRHNGKADCQSCAGTSGRARSQVRVRSGLWNVRTDTRETPYQNSRASRFAALLRATSAMHLLVRLGESTSGRPLWLLS